MPFPEPTEAASSRAAVLVRYLDYFRDEVVAKIGSLDDAAARHSLLPSRWTPLELAKHLTFVELRWLEWGFEGRTVAEPVGRPARRPLVRRAAGARGRGARRPPGAG